MMKKLIAVVSVLVISLSVFSVTISGGTKLYLEPNSNWQSANARFVAYFFGGNDGVEWVNMTKINDPNKVIYEAVSPIGKSFNNVLFGRMKPDDQNNNFNNPPMWNQTNDLTYNGTLNSYKITEGAWSKGDGSWSSYAPPVTFVGNSYIVIQKDANSNWDAGTWYNGSATGHSTAFDGINLGVITENFKLGGELQVYYPQTTAATMTYKINSSSNTNISLPNVGTIGNNSKHQGGGLVSIEGLNPGQYTLSVWFHHTSNYDNKGGANYNATFTIPEFKTFTVTVPKGTEKVYIAGTFPDKSWKINAVDNPYELQVTENPRVFTGTFQCGSDIQYKYLNGTDDSDYYEGTDNLELTSGAGSKPKSRANRSYNASDEVKYWVASPKLTVEVGFHDGVAIPTTLHVKGKWNEWGEATELTYADGKFSGTINQKVYSNTTYKYRTNDVITANWEIRKLPNTENTNNPSNDRWAIYPSMSDKIHGFVTDPMVHVGRKPANNLKIEEDLTITLPTGAAVNYLLTTDDFSEDNPTDEYDATNGIEIATSGVYYLKRKISQNDSSYIKQTPINIGPITWKDNGNTTWGTATNWTINSTVVNRTPITKEDVVIPASLSNYPILNTDANIGSLEIASGAKLTINTESKLAVDGNITNNNGASGILIKADPDKATGTLLFNNPVNEPVQATVEMYARGSWDATSGQIKNVKWQYFGIPFTHIDNIENAFYGAIIRKHNEAGTTSSSILPVETGKWVQLMNGSSLVPIQGYEIAQPSPKTYVLSGTLYKGDFNYTVSYTSDVTQAGQHIISNPYMAAIPIDAINFGADSKMDETVYVYNTGSLADFNANESKTGVNPGQYIASPLHTGGYGDIPNEIAPMQGFLVRTAQGVTDAGSFSIAYNQLVKNTAKQRAPKSPKSWLRLTLSAENTGDVMWLFSEPETSRDFDNGWDGRKMGGDAGTPMLFSHNETGNYQINAMDDIDETDIAFRAGNADTEYTITFNHGDGLMGKYVDMYCEDLVTGAIINISEDNTEYSFQSTNTNIHSRFKIHATKVISDVNKEEIMPVYVYADGRNLVINNASKESSRIDLYDTLGRLFVSYQVEGGEMQTYQPNVQQGTYIVKVTNSKIRSTKVVLR